MGAAAIAARAEGPEPRTLARRLLALRLERIGLLVDARGGTLTDARDVLEANRAARERLLTDAIAEGAVIPQVAMFNRFGLSALEMDVLDLAASIQLDAPTRARVIGACPSVATEGLTVGAAVALLASSIEARLDFADELQHSRLYALGFLRRPAHDGIAREVIPTRRAIAALLGRGPLDVLPAWAWRTTLDPGPERGHEVDPGTLASAIRGGGILAISGPAGVGKSVLALAVAQRLKTEVVVADVLRCATHPRASVVDELVELIEDAALAELPLVLDPIRGALAHVSGVERIAEACERTDAQIVLCVDEAAQLSPGLTSFVRMRAELRGVRGPLAVEIFRAHAPDAGDRLGFLEDVQLRPREIAHAAELAARLDMSPELAVHAMQTDSAGLLDATRVQLTLEDIVVSPSIRAGLLEVIGSIRARSTVFRDWGLARRISRGRGISALFDGEPGTGKTLAAEVIAHAVGLPLKRVNVAGLMDKYVGETEKNLQRLFADARAASYILLFDEADALFATRSDGKGSNDRYSNLEIDLLLQLMEEHDGIAILTTNLSQNLDKAFLRRISYHIEFEAPDEKLREQIWRDMLPATVIERDVDPRQLAKAYPLAGGHIKSAVLRACYRAAAADRKVTLADLEDCAEAQCAVIGRVVTSKRSTLQ